MVVCSLLTVVLGIVGGFLIASNKAVATAAVRLSDTQDARNAEQRIAATVQFATSLSVSNGKTLYAEQVGGTCDIWSISGTDLELTVGSQTSTIAADVVAPTSGSIFERNTSYPGLVSVRFTVKQATVTTGTDAGMSVDDTFTAANLPVGGGVTTTNSC
jgi:hypothetical protein